MKINFSFSLWRTPIQKSNIIYRMQYIMTNEFLCFLYIKHYSQKFTIKYRFYILKNINFMNFYSLSLNLFYFFQYWPNYMICQVIWPKHTFLHFCTLEIQYHIWCVPNFFLGSIFSILQSFLQFCPNAFAEGERKYSA